MAWYVVGGRWASALTTKLGKSCDEAKIKDIDFDYMSAELGEERWSTFAMLDLNGEWHEKGKMGWWGMNNATSDSEKAFIDCLYKYIESVDPNTYLVIVDCHI